MSEQFKAKDVFNEIPILFQILSYAKVTGKNHYHNYYEFFLVKKGSIIHLINNQIQNLTENSLTFIRPNDTHYFQKAENQKGTIINIAFSRKIFQKVINFTSADSRINTLLNTELPPRIMIPARTKYIIEETLEEILTISRTQKKLKKIKLKSLLTEIFIKFLQPETDFSRQLPEWLYHIYLQMQKKENFISGRDTLMKISSKSESYTTQMMKKYFQKTPTQFINNLRLNYAGNLLINTDQEISTIARKSGFNNLRYFYQVFNEKYNQPPAHFRRKHQKKLI